MKIILFIEKIHFFFNFKFNKDKAHSLWIYKFFFLISIYTFIKIIFFESDNEFIIIKNAEGDPNSLAKIVIQNKIKFIPKVSVIIPVYNTNQFLNKCLDSIINQTLEEIEIICVDDGSTDNSLYILKNYANKDKRITILKQNNLHAGVARNAGLAVAKGEYLSFLDSDDFFDLNMLKEMYEKIKKEQSDIITCQSRALDLDTGLFDEKTFSNSIRFDLIPKKTSFSPLEISNNIFQIFEGWAWDKLFKKEFILFNNIKFLNIINFNDNQFTYIALCKAKSITTIKKKLVIKRHGHKSSLTANRKENPFFFLNSFEKIKSNLEKSHLYHLFKKSFMNWVIKLCFIQLKNLDKKSKENLFDILHKKFNSLNFSDYSNPFSNKYMALHYIKYQKLFPTINIAYFVDKKNFNICLISIVSILKNSEYENINFILLYNDISYINLSEINKLKKIRSFFLQTLYIPNEHYKYFQSKEKDTKTILLTINLIKCLLYYFADKNRILYLSCNTIVKKSLLFLWELNFKNNFVAAIEVISSCKTQKNKINLLDNYYINDGILFLNIEEWKKNNLIKKLYKSFKNNNIINQINQNNRLNQDIFNILTDIKKIKINKEYNSIKILVNISKLNQTYLKLNKEKKPEIIHFLSRGFWNINRNSVIKEFLKYNSILNDIKNITLTIPIVLSSDSKNAPLMYTTMISILENGYKNTYYIFYLLVPSDFSKSIENKILEIYYKYRCFIYFIYLKNLIEIFNIQIEHISLVNYYCLLIGNLLDEGIEKCIYLDVDICVIKDLSDLFLVEMNDNYIAGVVYPSYYFKEKQNYKRLNLTSMRQYVNSGVLVMNLKQIRKDNVIQKFIELSKKNHNLQVQDILNIVCFGKIMKLSQKYNLMVSQLKNNNHPLKNIYKEENFIKTKDSPYIINYFDKKKPWNSIKITMENYWWEIAKKTPFIDSLFSRENIYKDILNKFYYKITKKQLNFDKPVSFYEKIQWLKVYESTPIKTKLSDKYMVREWVSEKIGVKYLIPLIGVYDKFEDINFENLPNQFVIKCNHGRGYYIIVKDKYQLKFDKIKKKIENWMNTNYAYNNGLELHYRDIKHKIIIEKYMDDGNNNIKDYKVICFDGKPNFIFVDGKRHSTNNFNLYNLNWNKITYKINSKYSDFPSQKKPKYLKKLLMLASLLSHNFTYVNVCFFIIHDKIYFDEMLFSSIRKDNKMPYSLDLKLSSLIRLPKLVYNIDSGKYYILRRFPSLYHYYLYVILLSIKIIYRLRKLYFFNNIIYLNY